MIENGPWWILVPLFSTRHHAGLPSRDSNRPEKFQIQPCNMPNHASSLQVQVRPDAVVQRLHPTASHRSGTIGVVPESKARETLANKSIQESALGRYTPYSYQGKLNTIHVWSRCTISIAKSQCASIRSIVHIPHPRLASMVMLGYVHPRDSPKAWALPRVRARQAGSSGCAAVRSTRDITVFFNSI